MRKSRERMEATLGDWEWGGQFLHPLAFCPHPPPLSSLSLSSARQRCSDPLIDRARARFALAASFKVDVSMGERRSGEKRGEVKRFRSSVPLLDFGTETPAPLLPKPFPPSGRTLHAPTTTSTKFKVTRDFQLKSVQVKFGLRWPRFAINKWS